MKADLNHLDGVYIGYGWWRGRLGGVIQLDSFLSSFAVQIAELAYSLTYAADAESCEEQRSGARKLALEFMHQL
jgi:hypothetical protein